jgi:hypothetical protein
MKYIEFSYTDRNNKASIREALVLQEPNKFVNCIDVSELEFDEQAMLASGYNKLLAHFQEEVLALYHKYDVVNNYRQFDPEKMSITHSEYI